MNLDKVTAELRPRTPWESADFGVRLIRRDAAAIYKAWFATSLPLLAIALGMIYLTPFAGYALLFYWWFEPVLDGPILDIIARRLFGGEANVKSTIRSTGRLAWRNKLFWLTPWRFHFSRSTAMPLTQLEGLSGGPRRRRATVMNQAVMNNGIGVTVAYQHLVLVVYIGILLGLLAFIPQPYQNFDTWDAAFVLWESDSQHAAAANLILFYIAQTLLEPWFVGAGFGLYINCRTRLEAWDIEVAFRRMVAKRAAPAIAVLLAVGLFVGAGAPTPAMAQSEADPGFSGFWENTDYEGELESVLDDAAFNTEEIRSDWVRKNPRPQTPDRDRNLEGVEGFLETLGQFAAFIAEFGLWILVALLVVFLYLKRDYWLPYLMIEPSGKRERQRVILSTGEVTADTLPDDIPTTVRKLWSEGKQREALSLLYRGTVFALVDHHGVRLPVSATEGSCVEAVDNQASASQSALFRSIVDAWIRLAYGARPPSGEAIDQLTRGWSAQYGAPA